MIKCSECEGQVSTKAANCPNCGAPFKAFMGPAKGFKDFFSVERTEHRVAEAEQAKKSAGRSLLKTIVWTVIILAIIVIVLL